jgi:hypothetical protein
MRIGFTKSDYAQSTLSRSLSLRTTRGMQVLIIQRWYLASKMARWGFEDGEDGT